MADSTSTRRRRRSMTRSKTNSISTETSALLYDSSDRGGTLVPNRKLSTYVCGGLFVFAGFVLVWFCLPTVVYYTSVTSSREEDIYCRGDLLHAVQSQHSLFPDSKHFVDMPMKASADVILTAFRSLQHQKKKQLTKSDLRQFIDQYFSPPGTELIAHVPIDFQEQPVQLMQRITNTTLRNWALELNQIWKQLTRKVDVQHRRNRWGDSLLELEFPFVIPGGRFREIYYWDTYWIVQGLCVCGMTHTAKGMVQNLLNFVKKYGFVPNGSRVYYLTRSQPPLLSEMVKLIYNATGDVDFLKKAVPLLDIEYDFWMQTGVDGHAVEVTSQSMGTSHILNHYNSFKTNSPRPESYREDVATAMSVSKKSEKTYIYRQIIAAAESGWDFSSRWMSDGYKLNSLLTASVIPVDLNSIMLRMEENIMLFHRQLGNLPKADNYKKAALNRLIAIENILWNDTDSMWKDFIVENASHSSIMSISNFIPLWANCYDSFNTTHQLRILNSLKKSGLIGFGFQTTTMKTGQQWDGENAWPPLQDFIIEGLRSMKIKEAIHLGRNVAAKWIVSNFQGFFDSKSMFEKYNSSFSGGIGSGGEYSTQLGFGWTNGVVLKLLMEYADPELFSKTNVKWT